MRRLTLAWLSGLMMGACLVGALVISNPGDSGELRPRPPVRIYT